MRGRKATLCSAHIRTNRKAIRLAPAIFLFWRVLARQSRTSGAGNYLPSRAITSAPRCSASQVKSHLDCVLYRFPIFPVPSPNKISVRLKKVVCRAARKSIHGHVKRAYYLFHFAPQPNWLFNRTSASFAGRRLLTRALGFSTCPKLAIPHHLVHCVWLRNT